jgi:hypothetical protein
MMNMNYIELDKIVLAESTDEMLDQTLKNIYIILGTKIQGFGH